MIVFDEIQNFRDIYLNGDRRLVLFMFLVMTPGMFFIEKAYSSSALKNTSRYYLVDYFDDETAFKILVEERLSREDARYVVEWIGGISWMIEEVVKSDDPKNTAEELYEDHRARLLRNFLLECEMVDEVREVLRDLLEGDFELSRNSIKAVKELVKSEVLFYDPLKGNVRFQTKLDERAARELLRKTTLRGEEDNN